ncbi:MAG TPA: hypothetical protein VJ729_16965 [Nitrososphaeraceae archaeon]|nr:hypothetical protein [Nitrososphaeraceae archaeon]
MMVKALSSPNCSDRIYKNTKLIPSCIHREMILDTAETVLGFFGFDRTFYSNLRNTGRRRWKWCEEMKK